jgi:hypothetical protein
MLSPAITTSHQVTRFNPNEYRIRQAAFDYGIAEAKRIRDWALLEEAVDIKIAEQVQFVAWWDANVSVNYGGNRAKQVSGSGYLPYREAERLTGMKQPRVSELNARLQHPEQYRLHLLGAAYRAAMLEPKWNYRAGSGQDKWYTPPEWAERVRKVFGGVIDLDVASDETGQKIVQAKGFFTKYDNPLEQNWYGKVYGNVPYSQPEIALFTDKLLYEIAMGHTEAAIWLTNNNTQTDWFQKTGLRATAICCPRGSIKFSDGIQCVHASAQGQAFFYFGDDLPAFVQHFRPVGFIVRAV